MKRLVLDKNNQAEIIKQAISILKKGGVIVYPTETAYALGADFLNKKATNKIYKIKGRGSSKELPIIVSSLSMAKEYVKFNKLALKLARKYWPGPLTLVLETKQGKTLALRKTSNKFTLSLVKKLKVPIISTSANISGKTNCFKVDDIIKQFKNNRIKPDLIIEMGIAHGGSVILSASLLALLDLCENGQTTLAPDSKHPRSVIAADIDIRAHNRKALEEHPLYPRLKLIEGSSVEEMVIDQVKKEAEGYERILVCLDSNHTHDHVLAELEAYAPLTSPGSYCLVFDTVIEDLPEKMSQDRPWGPGNSPKTAVREYIGYLQTEGRTASDGQPLILENDKQIQDKLLITVAPDGYLKRK